MKTKEELIKEAEVDMIVAKENSFRARAKDLLCAIANAQANLESAQEQLKELKL
jgi:hypothetical protein